MDFFNIDYQFLAKQMLPVRLRKPRMAAWIHCLVAPIRWLHGVFLTSRTNDLYYLAHNSQVVFLEAALNDTFDSVGREITISDGTYLDPIFTFTYVESSPVWLASIPEVGTTPYSAPITLYTEGETSNQGNSFIITVPVYVSFDEERMRALVNRHRLAGKNVFQIVIG